MRSWLPLRVRNINNGDTVIVVMDIIYLIIIIFVLNQAGMAFWGAVPPLIIGYLYLRKTQKALEEVQAIRTSIPGVLKGKGEEMIKEVIDYLGTDDFMSRLRASLNGQLGKEVQVFKAELIKEHDLSGLPVPVVEVVAKGASGYLKDYLGVPKKAAEMAIKALFKPKVDPTQNDSMIQGVASDLGIQMSQEPTTFDPFVVPTVK